MNQSFQINNLNLKLQLAIIALVLVTIQWLTKEEVSTINLLWLFIGLESLATYILYKKHKYIQISESQIHIFHSIWKGKQSIDKLRIKELEITQRNYYIHLLEGKKVKIKKSHIHKDEHFKLEVALKKFCGYEIKTGLVA